MLLTDTFLQCGAAIIWDIAEFITLCANKKGIHPGAHIALDFLLFAALITGAVFLIIVGQPIVIYTVYSDSENYPADSVLLAAGALAVIAGSVQTSANYILLQRLTVALITSVFHLTLFIMACIGVHNWRQTRQPQVIFVQQPRTVTGAHATLPPPPPGMMYVQGDWQTMSPQPIVASYLVPQPDPSGPVKFA